MIEIRDNREPKPDGTIYYLDAIPGKLYETVNGDSSHVTMAVSIPSKDYRQFYPSGLGFLNPDGIVYPYTTERLVPLHGHTIWIINNHGD